MSARPAVGKLDPAPVVIWRISDGVPGHDNQSRGLVEAIERRVASRVCEFRLEGGCLLRTVPALLRATRDAPDPRLLVGAGRRTHLPLLAARWRRGGRSVLLMRPDLPRRLFDVCIVPAHDGIAADRHTLVTRGAINRARPAPEGKHPHCALMLIGGPSREYGWSDDDLLAQVRALTDAGDRFRWQLCDSRRTPARTRAALASLQNERISHVAWDTVSPDWLPQALARASIVWVTRDSASMVYEALSSQAAVGLLDVPLQRRGRVSSGVEALRADGMVTAFDDWRQGRALQPPALALAEADRCAQWLEQAWLRDAG